MGVYYFTMTNFTHRVVHTFKENGEWVPVGTLMSDESWTPYGKKYVEEKGFVVRLTPEEIAELSKPAVEVSAEPVLEADEKPVAKKSPAKKAVSAKKAAPSTDK
jgi:hypothetical protein